MTNSLYAAGETRTGTRDSKDRYETPSGTVFDPFMGTGTTGQACLNTGRNFIGSEIDPDYFEFAESEILDGETE